MRRWKERVAVTLRTRLEALEKSAGVTTQRIVVFQAPDGCPKADEVLMAEQGKHAQPGDQVVAINQFHARCKGCTCELATADRRTILVDTGVRRSAGFASWAGGAA